MLSSLLFPHRFSIVNLTKPDSLYKEGMRPLMYSSTDATNNNVGWQRCGENIAYFRNDDNNIYSTRNYHQVLMDDFDDDDSNNICSYTLTFQVEFQHENDTVYFAHSYPYTYSDLQDYLMNIQRHPVKSKFCKLRLLCRSVAGNNVYYLTVTAPSTPEEEVQKVSKRANRFAYRMAHASFGFRRRRKPSSSRLVFIRARRPARG
jgi:cytosolic carboxypeptidase protein 2/3